MPETSPQGAEITIYYSPGNPSLAVIDPTPDVLGLSLILGSGLLMIPVGLLVRRRAEQLQPSAQKQEPISGSKPTGSYRATGESKATRSSQSD